jgi:hypothetical protein
MPLAVWYNTLSDTRNHQGSCDSARGKCCSSQVETSMELNCLQSADQDNLTYAGFALQL